MNAEMGGNPEAENLIQQINAVQEALKNAKSQEEAESLQQQLMSLVERAKGMGIIK
ncbi:MAG: hypothetical protein V1858_04860 [Candidatus Gottesmanbacteria bacterium]